MPKIEVDSSARSSLNNRMLLLVSLVSRASGACREVIAASAPRAIPGNQT
jgi:hypothetical protein